MGLNHREFTVPFWRILTEPEVRSDNRLVVFSSKGATFPRGLMKVMVHVDPALRLLEDMLTSTFNENFVTIATRALCMSEALAENEMGAETAIDLYGASLMTDLGIERLKVPDGRAECS